MCLYGYICIFHIILYIIYLSISLSLSLSIYIHIYIGNVRASVSSNFKKFYDIRILFFRFFDNILYLIKSFFISVKSQAWTLLFETDQQ